MPELTDDQLDGLFRKSAEEFDPPFDPAAWQTMKGRLDTNEHTRPGGVFFWKSLLRWGLPVLLLLLLTGVSWYAYRKVDAVGKGAVSAVIATPKSEESSPKPELTKAAKGGVTQTEPPRLADAERPNVSPTGSSEPKVSDVRESADRAESIPSPAKPENHFDKSTTRSTTTAVPEGAVAAKGRGVTKPVPSTYTLTTTKALSGQKRTNGLSLTTMPLGRNRSKVSLNRSVRTTNLVTSSSVRQRRKSSGSQDRVAFLRANDAIAPIVSFTKKRTTGGQEAMPPDAFAKTAEIIVPESKEAMFVELPTLNELASRPAKWPMLTFTNRPVIAQPDTVAQRVVANVPFQRGLSVRFAVAPDLSSIGLKNFSRPGTNVGVFLEYRLASRWSIQAGVIQSTKVYRALPTEYEIPMGWWSTPTSKLPDLVDGRCNMLDIPINVRYDFLLRPRADNRLVNRWFITGGITSYIMNKEDYHYTYPPHTYGEPEDVSTSTGGYRFSNLNLSVGYERALGKRLSWQIEPFIKVPLKGVGLFKVDLLSTGTFFSLRYKL